MNKIPSLMVTGLMTLATAAAQTGTVMPARELSPFESLSLFQSGSLTQVFPALKVATQGSVTTKNGSAADTDRKSNVAAAIYVGAALPNQPVSPAPAVNAAPVNQYFDFKKSGDSAQVFATAQANGLPFMYVNSFGQADARGTVSWSTRVVPTSVGATPVYVQFVLPKITINGFTEQDGLGRRQVRYRAELMVHDHPVWQSEALRQTVISNANVGPEDACEPGFEKANLLSTYGRTIGFTETESKESTKQTILLNLGSFNSTQPVDITFVLRLDAQSITKCCKKLNPNTGKDELFCTRATATVDWDNTITNPVRFYVGTLPIRAN